MHDREKILDKVQKLLRLANDKSNVNEAATAAKHAQQLMHKYNLTALMVESFDSDPDKNEEEIFHMNQPLFRFKRRASTWKVRLGMIVAEANHCRVWINRSPSALGLVGRPSDMEIVRFLFDYLLFEIERITLRTAAGKGKSWANNFRLGALDTIKERLKEAREESEKTLKEECEKTGVELVHVSSAIQKLSERGAVVEEWMKQNMNLKKGSQRTHKHHNGARQAGRRAGHLINLTPVQKKLAS